MSEERAPCGPGTITGCEGFPRLATCCLERSWEGGARLLDCALDLECERVQFWGEATTDDDIRRAREAGLVTNYFYTDDAVEAARLIASGVMAPLTNFPGRMRSVLADIVESPGDS